MHFFLLPFCAIHAGLAPYGSVPFTYTYCYTIKVLLLGLESTMAVTASSIHIRTICTVKTGGLMSP